MDTAVVILAAGKGTRMSSNRPKVMHEIGNFPMLSHCIKTAQQIKPWKVITVLGHGRTEIMQFLQDSKKSIEFVIQEEQLGTGHAVKIATKQLSNFDGNLIVMFGDTPFISYETLIKIKAKCEQTDLVDLGFRTEDSAGYGRLVSNGSEL